MNFLCYVGLYTIMNKKLAYLLVFLMLLGSALNAKAADTENTRYIVKSNSAFWKKSFGVRHNFEDGFTTDATAWQLRVAKLFGVEVEEVKKLYVLPATVSEDDALKAGKDEVQETKSDTLRRTTPTPSVLARPKPSDQTPWGIETIYNNPSLSKTSGGAGVNVAILDTGIYRSHPDLKNRVKDCKDFTGIKPITDGKCDDKNGHGTHVAGIISADGGSDGLGIYGVAPEANLWAYKVCSNNGSCWSDDIAVAIRTAADNGANVINMSLGSDSESSLIKNAITYAVNKKVLVVAAACNDGPYDGSIEYPAANVDVVGTGALDVNLVVTGWSSRGLNFQSQPYVKENKDIEFAAPGANIESTWKDGGYVILSGTSMASPHVAGLAAKLWQKNADNPALETRNLLRQFSRDLLPVGDDNASGWGLPTL